MSDVRFAVYRPSAFLADKYHDGDTWWFDIDLGYNAHFHTAIRLIGYDAPERTDPLGPAATLYGRTKLLSAREILVKTIERMTFNRWLAHVQVDGLDFAPILQAAKEAGFVVA